MSEKSLWGSLVDRVSPSKELLAVAERLNRMEGDVRVTSKGGVSVSASTIMHDANFVKACEAAKKAISNSKQG